MVMKYRRVNLSQKEEFNRLAGHPLQLWEWGEFKRRRGNEVIRWAAFDNQGRILKTYQLLVHRLPFNQTLIYFPRGGELTSEDLLFLRKVGRQRKAFMIKVEPYLEANQEREKRFRSWQKKYSFYSSSQPLFPPYTLRLDLTPGKEVLWKNLRPKTRYNIRLAARRGVEIIEDTSRKGVEDFVKLMLKTNKRHNFLSHTVDYYYDLFDIFRGKKVIKILKAVYQSKTIVVWWLFDWKDILYYPYGASDYEYRSLMASNLIAWKAIEYGLQQKKKIFDLWGAAPPDAGPEHPWAGFTRFKLSYGAEYWQTIGSWDLVINPVVYYGFLLANSWRKKWLKFKGIVGH